MNDEETTIGAYVDGIKSSSVKGKYLFDISLSSHCKPFLEGFTVPKYFAADFFQVRLSSPCPSHDSYKSCYCVLHST